MASPFSAVNAGVAANRRVKTISSWEAARIM
jgi:hypothetical protein